jgi:hypothetical protein
LNRRIAFATCGELPNLRPDERQPFADLARLGIQAEPAIWDDPGVRWEDYDGVVLRTVWDYHLKAAAFLAWVQGLEERGVRLCNPAPLVRWNIDKRYLLELAARGVEIIPTAIFERGARVDVAHELAERGWPRAVVKPAVSASAYRTAVLSAHDPAVAQAEVDALLATGACLLQPFVAAVVESGEWSFAFFDGSFSHAILKRPQPGDFRVQEEHGGLIRAAVAPAALLKQAQRVIDCIPGDWLYARVDGIETAGILVVMELELIDPAFYFDRDPSAAGRFASCVYHWSGGSMGCTTDNARP